MKRILILGCCGSGKSTFARQLHDVTGIPVIHLDQEYWRPGWIEPPKEEWDSIVADLADRETWIMDGNYARTYSFRIPRADTIIYLDKSTPTCVWRVYKRMFTHLGKVRPDMVEGCPERFNLEFLLYVLTFNFKRRKKQLNELDGLKKEKRVLVFRNDKEINAFLAETAKGKIVSKSEHNTTS